MRFRWICFVATVALCVARSTYGQLVLVNQAPPGLNSAIGNSIAYDPVHDRYLAVSRGYPSISGIFLDSLGAPLGNQLTLGVPGASFSSVDTRVAYSPDVSDGAGGHGAFIVFSVDTRRISVVSVSFPGTVGAPVTIWTASPTGRFLHADVAYSPVHRVFLIAVVLIDFTTEPWEASTTVIRLDTSVREIDRLALSTPPHARCARFESDYECTVPSVVWNPVSGEFGVAYAQGHGKVLGRIRGDGVLLSRTDLGIGPDVGALAVNTATGMYLAVGDSDHFAPQGAFGAEIDSAGRLVARGLITPLLSTGTFSYGNMALSYQPVSGTFLLSGSIVPSGLILELNQHGVALFSTPLPAVSPVIASHPVAHQWIVALYGRTLVFGTATLFGGPDARLGGCWGRDPFIAIGGGTCLNGGWIPRGLIGAPVAGPGLCTTPDPFLSLGGGVCVNGRWTLPPRTPQPTACITPKPGVDWVCVNGGWVPPTHPSVPKDFFTIPEAPFQHCTTPDPFVSIGGGVCVNGGWIPRRDP